MIREATAMDVRKNLGEILNEVQYRHDSIVITKGGKAVAAVVDVELFGKIRKMRAEFERLSAEIATAYAGVSEKQVYAEIDEAIKFVRKRSKKSK